MKTSKKASYKFFVLLSYEYYNYAHYLTCSTEEAIRANAETYYQLALDMQLHVDEHTPCNKSTCMLLFLVVAPPLEERYGSRTLLSGILMTALVSGILQCVLFPTSALLGASGIVFMLIMLSSLAGSKNGGIPITFILVGILYLSQQVYSILFIQDNVANFMHIVGGLCGTTFGFAVRKK